MPIGAITKNRAGAELVDFDSLAAAGVVGFSDDGVSTANSALMRSALQASKRLDLPIMVHCEDPYLVGGVMHEGEVSRRDGGHALPLQRRSSSPGIACWPAKLGAGCTCFTSALRLAWI